MLKALAMFLSAAFMTVPATAYEWDREICVIEERTFQRVAGGNIIDFIREIDEIEQAYGVEFAARQTSASVMHFSEPEGGFLRLTLHHNEQMFDARYSAELDGGSFIINFHTATGC